MRIHQDDIQEKMFEVLGFTKERAQDVYKRQQAKMPRKKIDKLVEHAKGCGAKGLAYLCINEDGTYKSSFAKFMTEAEPVSYTHLDVYKRQE